MHGDTEKGISSGEQVWDTLGDSNGKDSWLRGHVLGSPCVLVLMLDVEDPKLPYGKL